MKKIFDFIYIFLITMLGGSVFFAIKYGVEFRIILFLLSLIVLIRNIKKSNYNVIPLYFIIIIILFNTFINLNKGIKIDSVIAIGIVCFALAFIQDAISKEKFIKVYTKIMIYICLISLICFVLSFIIPPEGLPLYRKEYIDASTYTYSIYYTWGWSNLFEGRNSGIYWEPGAFQTYLNLGLLFLIFSKERKLPYKTIVLFIITIITTASTTGYIVLALIMLYTVLTGRIHVKSKKIKLFISIISILLAVTGTTLILNSEVISGKFSDTSERSSYNTRMNDTSSTIEIIKKFPLSGTGIYSDTKNNEEKFRGVIHNSNGILEFISMFGIPISIIYITYLFVRVKSFFDLKSFLDCLFILAIFIILFSSEGVVLRPVFMTFLFKWKMEDNKVKIYKY